MRRIGQLRNYPFESSPENTVSTWSHYQLEHHQATETQEAWETWVAPAMVGMDSASVKLQTLFCSVIFHGTKKSNVVMVDGTPRFCG